jgi:hypothetical protein
MRVGVDGHEEVGALLGREVGPLAERHEHIRAARQHHLDAEALFDHARGASGHVEDDVLLLHAGRPPGTGIVAAVARVEHDQLERRRAAVMVRGPSVPALSFAR